MRSQRQQSKQFQDHELMESLRLIDELEVDFGLPSADGVEGAENAN